MITGGAAYGPAPAARGDFHVDSWVLSSVCANSGGIESEFYTQLQNPYNPPPLVATRHNSIATASFAFNWSLATGSFHIDSSLTSEGGIGLPFCATDNRINFHISQPSLLSFDSEWTYHFTGGDRSSTIRFWVHNLDTATDVLIRGDTGDTVAGDPPTDTLYVADSILLTPGNYYVRSLMRLGAAGGSANSVSTAHGFADITLTTVPEPAGVLMLALGGVFVGRRGTRRSNRVRPPDVKNSNALSRR